MFIVNFHQLCLIYFIGRDEVFHGLNKICKQQKMSLRLLPDLGERFEYPVDEMGDLFVVGKPPWILYRHVKWYQLSILQNIDFKIKPRLKNVLCSVNIFAKKLELRFTPLHTFCFQNFHDRFEQISTWTSGLWFGLTCLWSERRMGDQHIDVTRSRKATAIANKQQSGMYTLLNYCKK